MAQKVRVVCTVEQFENFWIEYDASNWGLGTFIEVYDELTVPHVLTRFIPEYSTAWYIANQDGTVITHPGVGANSTAWRNVWRQFDVKTSRALYSWLWISALMAIQEAMALPPKSDADDPGDGAESEESA